MLPRISVVTCSFNQGKFIGRTIDSVLAQNYPNLEHIVVDGMSGDDTPAVLARYPHLHVIREPDSGQPEAVNKGFRRANGDIFCFLNSDDTFLPGALHRVAREIDPARGRHVVLGRCLFVDEADRPTGLEHPSAYRGHERVLEVWKNHCIPQPATFWTREVWEQCGPLDENEQLVLDFDLMCRISRRYRFHSVDQVLATYRLHSSSKTCSASASEINKQAIRASRRYWGSPLGLRYWRMLASMIWQRLENDWGRKQLAASLLVKSLQLRGEGRALSAAVRRAGATLLAPDVALRRFLLMRAAPLFKRWRPDVSTLALDWRSPRLPEMTTVWRSFRGVHSDQCVGPSFETTVRVEPGDRWLHLDGAPILSDLPEPLELEATLDGAPVLRGLVTDPRPFTLSMPVAELQPGPHLLEVTSRRFVVYDDYLGNGDFRPLAFQLRGVRLSPAGAHAEPLLKVA